MGRMGRELRIQDSLRPAIMLKIKLSLFTEEYLKDELTHTFPVSEDSP